MDITRPLSVQPLFCVWPTYLKCHRFDTHFIFVQVMYNFSFILSVFFLLEINFVVWSSLKCVWPLWRESGGMPKGRMVPFIFDLCCKMILQGSYIYIYIFYLPKHVSEQLLDPSRFLNNLLDPDLLTLKVVAFLFIFNTTSNLKIFIMVNEDYVIQFFKILPRKCHLVSSRLYWDTDTKQQLIMIRSQPGTNRGNS